MGKTTLMNAEAQTVLDELAKVLADDAELVDDAAWAGQYRAQLHEFRKFGGAAEPMQHVEQRSVMHDGGRLELRSYTPLVLRTDAAVLYFHGGGFIGGSIDTHDRLLRTLARSAGCKVIAVDYRRPPEHPFPTAAEDCFAAFAWLYRHAPDLGVNSRKLAVAGDSVGGLFSAVVSMQCRDRGQPMPALQISLYPNTDLRLGRDYASMHEFDGRIVNLAELERGLKLYLPQDSDRNDARASPLSCKDLRGLPPAWVLTCECDPLRDEGRAWAARLQEAGVAAIHREAAGLPHAFLQMAGRVREAHAIFDEIGAAITEIGVASGSD